MPENYTASVKVMRSHDYCHFEVILGTTELLTLPEVDAMRKEAARLADKAVEQYKVAKQAWNQQFHSQHNAAALKHAESVREIPENERTPEQKAALKAYEDACYLAQRSYDYEDEWDAYHDDED